MARARSAVLVSAIMVGALAIGSTAAGAHKRFALKEGVECRECHENPEGGGPRNLIGKYYQARDTLPVDRSPEGMQLVQGTVDRWFQDVLALSPVIRWSYAPVDDLPAAPAPAYEPLDDEALLRRLSLDLRGSVPSAGELARLQRGELTIEGALDEFMGSKDFQSTFLLYHRDLIRPRTGDYNTDVSLTRVTQLTVGGKRVFASTRLGEQGGGRCGAEGLVRVSPWWDRHTPQFACPGTASEALTVTVAGEELRCDTAEGQESGRCGCGPHMVFCYPDGIKERVIRSMKDEGARLAMEVVNTDQPYPTVLTSDWTMLDGGLEVFYAKLEGRLPGLVEPDIGKGWQRVERHERHAGVLSTPMMFNFFYNGRRWAQRTFEAFFCHEVTPDFDLLDDTKDAGLTVGVPYRDSPLLEPSLTVTESRACAACHMQLDGLARVKDRWDPFGRYHETTPRGQPIPQRAVFMGTEVDGVDGLGKALAASPVFSDCALNQLWEHMVGHRFQPHEQATRMALGRAWTERGARFKDAIRLIAATPEYRARANLKVMTRELYARAMGRATDVAWKVAGRSGWDVYYDKLGGMDYRKIELRDRRPGQGHSLAQMKGAAESCDELVARDLKREAGKRLLVVAGSPDTSPSDAVLDGNLANLYARALARPWSRVPEAERALMRGLFRDVARAHTVADGYRAVCAAVFGSADFALF